MTCKKCGYISDEKLAEKEGAKKLLHAHVDNSQEGCTVGHAKLMKVRT